MVHHDIGRRVASSSTNLLCRGSSTAASPFSSSSFFSSNVGVVVEAIIDSGSKAYGKIAVLATDYLTWAEGYVAIEKLFPEKRIAISKIDRDQFIKLWGEWGVEIGDQTAWNDEFTDWQGLAGERFLGFEELGIKDGELVGFHAAIEGLKDKIF